MQIYHSLFNNLVIYFFNVMKKLTRKSGIKKYYVKLFYILVF